jgi:hypothetical protein
LTTTRDVAGSTAGGIVSHRAVRGDSFAVNALGRTDSTTSGAVISSVTITLLAYAGCFT